MKKKKLKEELEIALRALEMYKGYMICGIKYADQALLEIEEIENKYRPKVVINFGKIDFDKRFSDENFRAEIVRNITDILRKHGL